MSRETACKIFKVAKKLQVFTVKQLALTVGTNESNALEWLYAMRVHQIVMRYGNEKQPPGHRGLQHQTVWKYLL